MKKAILITIMVVLLNAGVAIGAQYEKLAPTSAAAVSFAYTTYQPTYGARATECTCTLETADVRYTTHGTDPTTTTGHLLPIAVYPVLKLYGEEISNFAVIATSTTAALCCTCR